VQNTIDISVAVAIENGLITPIVFDADQLGLYEINQSVKALADKAKKNMLKPDEYQGGTFTISNLGMFGVSEFTAIINPPQAAILSVGGSRHVVGVDEDSNKLHSHTVMSVTLNYDVRAIDENTAAEFLTELAVLLENPTLILAGRRPPKQ